MAPYAKCQDEYLYVTEGFEYFSLKKMIMYFVIISGVARSAISCSRRYKVTKAVPPWRRWSRAVGETTQL